MFRLNFGDAVVRKHLEEMAALLLELINCHKQDTE